MAVTITAAQATVMVKALIDAEHYRRESAAAWCAGCAAAQDGACPAHTAFLAPADAYRELAAELAHVLTPNSAGRDVPAPRPASDLSRLGQERTVTNLTTVNGPPAAPSTHGISEPADLDLVRQALADASAWRAWKAEGVGCGDCDRLDPGRCSVHAADDELAAAYEELLHRLAGEEGPR